MTLLPIIVLPVPEGADDKKEESVTNLWNTKAGLRLMGAMSCNDNFIRKPGQASEVIVEVNRLTGAQVTLLHDTMDKANDTKNNSAQFYFSDHVAITVRKPFQ